MGSFQHRERSDSKRCTVEVRWGIFYWEFDCISYSLIKAVVNIPIQTLVISPWLLFRKVIISQLELGLPAIRLAAIIIFRVTATAIANRSSVTQNASQWTSGIRVHVQHIRVLPALCWSKEADRVTSWLACVTGAKRGGVSKSTCDSRSQSFVRH